MTQTHHTQRSLCLATFSRSLDVWLWEPTNLMFLAALLGCDKTVLSTAHVPVHRSNFFFQSAKVGSDNPTDYEIVSDEC